MVVENIITSLDNYKVSACMDGQSALDLLASRDYLPDLILLDVMMPGMSGYEASSADALSTSAAVGSVWVLGGLECYR